MELIQKEFIKIVNPIQSGKYCTNGLIPVNTYFDIVTNKWVWVFIKAETKELFDKWCKHEL